MRGTKVLVLVAALFFLGLPLWAGDACCAKGAAVSRQVENLADGVKVTLTADNPQEAARLQTKAMACDASCGNCPVHAEGVTRKVENIDKGVVITATSADPKQVAALQAHFAKMAIGSSAKGCCSKGGHEGKACAKATHKEGKQTGSCCQKKMAPTKS
ncbi:MAG: hypothetical protein ACUVRY_02995 [Thermoanaerobaculaceae bacterium]